MGAAEASGAGDAPGFERVVCGIDRTAISREAAHQARAVAGEEAHLLGVAVWDPGEAMYEGVNAPDIVAELRRWSETALRKAERELPGLEPRLVEGAVVAGLLDAIADADADLVAVGAHGRARFAPALGSMAQAMAHKAPCSVLVARGSAHADFPRKILHAADGSPESLEAARVAGRIAARSGAQVVSLSVGRDVGRAQGLAEESLALLEAGAREPIPEQRQGGPPRRIAEVAGSIGASLITMGSRGHTGLRSLGSVSERVARRAPCSVLIVRRSGNPPAEPSATTTD